MGILLVNSMRHILRLKMDMRGPSSESEARRVLEEIKKEVLDIIDWDKIKDAYLNINFDEKDYEDLMEPIRKIDEEKRKYEINFTHV